MENPQWHVLDDQLRPIVSNHSMTFAVNAATNALNEHESVLVCCTDGYFSRMKPLYIHIRMQRGTEYIGW